jgi:hypothetical protein
VCFCLGGGGIVLLNSSSYFLSSFSTLVNNTSTWFLSSSRSLRKGDHLSPSLFVIVMEALGRMISTTIRGGLLSSFYVGEIYISHLLFDDDTLIFCGANPNHLHHPLCLFLYFEVVSSLKINLAK